MMDGLECREVNLQEIQCNKDFRVDSSFYTARIPRNPGLRYEPVGKYLNSSQYGVSREMNENGVGYPIYRMNEIHHMLCDIKPAKYVELSENEFEKLKLRDGDVLFNRTNSYELVGRTGIYYENCADQTYASYLVRLNPDNKHLLSEYLVAFLNSKYGMADIKRRARQSINQTNVNPEEVKEIQIPLLSSDFQKLIRKCFIRANELRNLAVSRYAAAEAIISGIFKVSHNNKTVVFSNKSLTGSFSLTGRLDAEYYQDKYEDYTNALHTEHTVASLCKLNDRNFIPEANERYRYIELSNVGITGDISGTEIQTGEDLPSRARRRVKTGQVLVSSVEGSLQSCALITDEFDGAVCSTGFYAVDSDSINPETLLVLFKSEPIQALMKQRCSGTILTAITKDEFLSMPFPETDSSVQEEIAIKVQESFALRRESEHLTEYTKQAVETAIEQDEESALEWLKDKTVEL